MGPPGAGPAYAAPSDSFALPMSPTSLEAMINSIIPDSALGGDADMAGGGGAADAEPPRTHRGGWPDLDKPSSMTARFDSVIASLYDALPLQDQDSGVRFPVGCDKELADHKDWLFRKREKNKRAESRLGRGWFEDAETWVLLTDSKTEAEKKSASAFEEKALAPEDDPELVLQQSILCTDDNKDARCSCGCNELLNKYFDDDREEWRYKSAVSRKGKLLHAQHWLDVQKSGDMPSPLMQPGSPLNLGIGSSVAIPGFGGTSDAPMSSVDDDDAGGGGAAADGLDDGARTPPGFPGDTADAAITTAATETGHLAKKQRI
eukprot:m.234616 g.234616  ORF g.234616 m.234616 type:complete len:319 (-) comp26130_c0_seq1:71-1027(-)